MTNAYVSCFVVQYMYVFFLLGSQGFPLEVYNRLHSVEGSNPFLVLYIQMTRNTLLRCGCDSNSAGNFTIQHGPAFAGPLHRGSVVYSDLLVYIVII